ncbi:hypothetical protein MY10362_008029 [Beauveria mimosiformis]
MNPVSIFRVDQILDRLHTEAERHDEWAANRFMLRYFTKHVFHEDWWVIGTEVPPREDHCLLRMDLSVQEYNTSRRAFVFRLIGQAKKGKSGPKMINVVEAQAVQLCQEYMLDPMQRQEIKAVWVLTYYGTKLRIWVCRLKDSVMDPFYPLDGEPGDKKAYRDVKKYEHDFDWAFAQVKGSSPPARGEIKALYESHTPADTVDAVSAQAPAVTSGSLAGPSMPASHRAAGSFEQHTSGHSDIPGQTSRFNEWEYERIHVVRVSADLTLCRAENGREFNVRRERWRKATLVKEDGGMNEGYIAQLSKNNFCTYDDPVHISEEGGKGKRKAL